MYHHLRGKLVDVAPTLVVLEAGGVGYELRVPLSTSEVLKGAKEAFVYTRLVSRDDQVRLYGFSSRGEREVFELILSVSGVGPAIALAALSALSVAELVTALAAENVGVVRRIKGVGKKLAERMVVELKDRAKTLEFAERVAASSEAAPRPAGDLQTDPTIVDAAAALVELGFHRRVALEKAEASYKGLLAQNGESDRGQIRVAQLVREALRRS